MILSLKIQEVECCRAFIESCDVLLLDQSWKLKCSFQLCLKSSHCMMEWDWFHSCWSQFEWQFSFLSMISMLSIEHTWCSYIQEQVSQLWIIWPPQFRNDISCMYSCKICDSWLFFSTLWDELEWTCRVSWELLFELNLVNLVIEMDQRTSLFVVMCFLLSHLFTCPLHTRFIREQRLLRWNLSVLSQIMLHILLWNCQILSLWNPWDQSLELFSYREAYNQFMRPLQRNLLHQSLWSLWHSWSWMARIHREAFSCLSKWFLFLFISEYFRFFSQQHRVLHQESLRVLHHLSRHIFRECLSHLSVIQSLT